LSQEDIEKNLVNVFDKFSLKKIGKWKEKNQENNVKLEE